MRNPIVTREKWLEARKGLLKQEKALTRERAQLAEERRRLPWVRIDQEYVFETSAGPKTLRELFVERSQLIVYHFMLGPGWEEGCSGCSFLADHFAGPLFHLPHRDVSFVAVSRAPLEEIQRFQRRMNWGFPWVSSNGSRFNFDFQVAFERSEGVQAKVIYNYEESDHPASEAPGISVFYRDGEEVFHTYSTFGRGLENFIGTYDYLDLTPKGRDEEGVSPYPMAWVRHHDRYPAQTDIR